MKKVFKTPLIILFWIALWALIALCVNSSLIVASPLETAQALGAAVITPAFWLSILTSLWHIALGLLAGCLLGCILGICAARHKLLGDFLNPILQFLKSAPIVCFIVLLLVWINVYFVDLVVVLIAVLPLYYFSMKEGYGQRNKKIIEMLNIFCVPFKTRIAIFEWPTLVPYFRQSTQVAVGMAWKSGVTAQLISLTTLTIGEQIYLNKISLDTPKLFMWTIVVMLLGWGIEKLALYIMKTSSQKFTKTRAQFGIHTSTITATSEVNASKEINTTSAKTKAHKNTCDKKTHGRSAHSKNTKSSTSKNNSPASKYVTSIRVQQISKRFKDKQLFDNVSFTVKPGERIALAGTTGSGKSTLLNILMGFIDSDEGRVLIDRTKPDTCTAKTTPHTSQQANHKQKVFSVVFQEERLLPQLSALQNVCIPTDADQDYVVFLLSSLIDKEAITKLPTELSGGMKRCVELCRALAADSNCLVLDEPFNGLDDEKRIHAIELINQEIGERSLVIVTHDLNDVAPEKLNCRIVKLSTAPGLDKCQ